MATHSSVLAWRIPGTGEPGGLPSMGSHRVRHYWSDLAAAAAAAMATHSNTLAWKIPCTEDPGRLQSMGSLRVRHDWATSLSLFTFMHWRRKWQPTPVFLPGESQGRGSLLGCSMGSHRVGHDWSDLAAVKYWLSHCLSFYILIPLQITLLYFKRYSICLLKVSWSSVLPKLSRICHHLLHNLMWKTNFVKCNRYKALEKYKQWRHIKCKIYFY